MWLWCWVNAQSIIQCVCVCVCGGGGVLNMQVLSHPQAQMILGDFLIKGTVHPKMKITA